MSQLCSDIYTDRANRDTFVGACVAGEFHEIGGRMVADFFGMAGWNSFYLGANTTAENIVKALVEHKARVLGISATLTPHLRTLKKLVRQVRDCPDCVGVKILVGGYPFNIDPDLWCRVDADGFARDAASVVELAMRLID
jgi:methanogenic corrinoid protein MtbC1